MAAECGFFSKAIAVFCQASSDNFPALGCYGFLKLKFCGSFSVFKKNFCRRWKKNDYAIIASKNKTAAHFCYGIDRHSKAII